MLINENHAQFNLQYSDAPVQMGDMVFVFRENEVLLRADVEADRLPRWDALAEAYSGEEPNHAFTQGTRRCYIAAADRTFNTPAGLAWESIRVFRHLMPAMDAMLLTTAYHLWVWYRQHRFCGACGGDMRPQTTERSLTCHQCGLTVYPTLLPAVIVAVTHGDQLLLARNAQGVFRQFSLIAGFVEAGETAEQAVAREVLEEVGLRLNNIRYIASQPWGISQSLMLGFTAELAGSPEIRLQESELAEARWFPRHEIPLHDSNTSIASALMERFKRNIL